MRQDTPGYGSEPTLRPAADPLAFRLQAWRRRQDAPHDNSALVRRVRQAVRSDPALVPAPAKLPRKRWVGRSLWLTAGLAATLVIAWFARPVRENGNPADWPLSVRFMPRQLSQKAELMAGMEATFGDGLAWIAEHDRRVEVGLVPDNANSRRRVAVRIVVLTRRVDEATWQPAWQSDVVARDEEVVDVATGTAGTGRLRLWAHALPDGAFAVDGVLTLADATMPIDTSYSGVQRPGEPRRVTGDRTRDVEWQIIQTVAPLDVTVRPLGDVS